MEDLNPAQRDAVTAVEGPLLIIAGAGSGKTRVITCRIAHMLDKGIPQSQILALTFTNKAAREMENRVKELTGRKLQNLTVSTFHAFGVRVLRQDIGCLGFRTNFSIYDEVDRGQLIKDTGKELRFTADALDVYKIGVLFSNIKTGLWNWESANDQYRKLYEEYQSGLKLFNAVDFDDLITLPIRLFQEHPDILEIYRQRYRYILVDEFQDTSMQQYTLMRLLADRNVAVVGDDDQSIYSWRGANYENIRLFEADFPGAREIRLEQNYRSTGTILAAANGVIAHNTNRKGKSLWSGNGDGKPIEICFPDNEAGEAEFIAEIIQSLRFSEKRRFEDFCVLMRANTQSRAIEEALLSANVPYRMSGGTSFFQRKEIKDVISYLRVCANHDDDVNLLRVINTPPRGIGRKTIEGLNSIANARQCSLWQAMQAPRSPRQPDVASLDFGVPEGPPDKEKRKGASGVDEFTSLAEKYRAVLLSGRGLAGKIRALIEEINYYDYLLAENQKNDKAARFKLMNIESLLNSIDQWENDPDNADPSLFSWLNRITLLSRDDLEDENLSGKVNLMTIHAAKGLEFPVVFIAGAEEGLLPHARSLEDSEDAVEEERRLFYVAITRARDKLYISSCRKRRRMQGLAECTPSRFIDEIPANLVELHEPDNTEVTGAQAAEMFAAMRKRFGS
jgi:DNA helicase-2/ATP-dependent DNA helicase PcrA